MALDLCLARLPRDERKENVISDVKAPQLTKKSKNTTLCTGDVASRLGLVIHCRLVSKFRCRRVNQAPTV